MTEENNKPLTEAELQIQRLLGLKKKHQETAENQVSGEGSFIFPEMKNEKQVEKRVKAAVKHKNTVKLDSGAYAKLSALVKKLNSSIQGTKVSKDRLAAAIIARVIADETIFAGADTKEKIENIIKALEIRSVRNE